MNNLALDGIAKKAVCFFAIFSILSGCGNIIYRTSGIYKEYSHIESILEPINKVRADGTMCGSRYYKPTGHLLWNEMLADTALQHSLDMAKNGFLSHEGSDSSSPGERLHRAGYIWTSHGENIGQGYRTPEDAVRAWLRNERHCKNIMNPEFKEAGASFARSKNLRTYWTLVLGTSKHQLE
ncbi:MAG: CAP domain-containing protein [Nitrospirae bacterium]|nr:CAP domain-containing protein [Nitrospirota bacterium]